MRNFDEATITDAVLQHVRAAKDDRVRQVSEALVRHLHAFVREIEPTQAEWEAGIDFLTRTGQMCDDKRQEFILLSDTLGVSMLVDAINHRTPEGATETTVLGPFYVQRAPEHPLGADISGTMEGAPLLVTGTVSTAGGKPLAGAVVDVWHSDDNSYYDVQQLDKIGDLAMRARFRTDESGHFWFWSIKPAAYPIPHDGPVGKMLEAQGPPPLAPGPRPFHDISARTPDAGDACIRRGRSIPRLGRRLWRQEQPDPGVRRHAGGNGRRWPRDDAALLSSELRFRTEGEFGSAPFRRARRLKYVVLTRFLHENRNRYPLRSKTRWPFTPRPMPPRVPRPARSHRAAHRRQRPA
jgi:hydroxyquinol 1,2-dioxygenase